MIYTILVLVILGLCLYLIETYIPMSPPIKLVIRIVVVIFCVLWILKVFGIADVPMPRAR
jgi:hypothetical protein